MSNVPVHQSCPLDLVRPCLGLYNFSVMFGSLITLGKNGIDRQQRENVSSLWPVLHTRSCTAQQNVTIIQEAIRAVSICSVFVKWTVSITLYCKSLIHGPSMNEFICTTSPSTDYWHRANNTSQPSVASLPSL